MLPFFLARPGLALTGAVLALAALLAGCDNDCDFVDPRCNGNVIETCGGGPDQMFHRRIERSPCEAPNSVCADANGSVECVATSKTACEVGQAAVCRDDAVVSCSATGYEKIEVCDPAYSACQSALTTDKTETAVCAHTPTAACDESFVERCEGSLAITCSPETHLIVAEDCTATYRDPAATCTSHTYESGLTSSYCVAP